MDHLAIMKKSRWLVPKILTGKKTVETRRYMNKSAPRDKIKKGDTVYFKDSGCPVTVKATVSNVEQFADVNDNNRQRILERCKYADVGSSKIPSGILAYTKGKKYCIIVHLAYPCAVKPFNVDKSGYGIMAAWICVNDIKKIKI